MNITLGRELIDRIDEQLIALIGERCRIAKSIGKFKSDHLLPLFDPDRELDVEYHIRDLAAAHGVDAYFAAEFARTLLKLGMRAQKGEDV